MQHFLPSSTRVELYITQPPLATSNRLLCKYIPLVDYVVITEVTTIIMPASLLMLLPESRLLQFPLALFIAATH